METGRYPKSSNPYRPKGQVLRDAKMWWNSTRNDGFGVLIALGALLLLAMILVWDTVRAEQQQRTQAERTDHVISILHEIIEHTTTAESGQRGYFITGDSRYLAPYDTAKQAYRTTLGELREYTADNAAALDQDIVKQIGQLTEQKFGELDESVALIARNETEAARTLILSNRGLNTMEQLRSAISRFEAMEREQLLYTSERAASAEARIVPGLVLMFLMILAVLALGMWQVRRLIDAEVRAANADELGEARDRADLLSRELNHRIKNLFAVVLAIVRMSGRGDPEAKPALERVATRISALLNAHELTQSGGAAVGADLGKLIETAVAPYRSDAHGCEVGGPELILSDAHALPLGLVLHELATNAVKYGAWSQPGGMVKVHWTIADDHEATVIWEEHCSFTPADHPADERVGFGTKLAESSARQLLGTIERTYAAHGLVLQLIFPVGQLAEPETED
ncbi:MAG: sensor histidine kinase [Novosphingobium sp.]